MAWYGDTSSPTPVADGTAPQVAFTTAGYENNLSIESGCHNIIGHYKIKDGQQIEMGSVELNQSTNYCTDPKAQMQAISQILKQITHIEKVEGGNLLLKQGNTGIRLEQAAKQGKTRFIWFRGVLSWGLPMFILMTLVFPLLLDSTTDT